MGGEGSNLDTFVFKNCNRIYKISVCIIHVCALQTGFDKLLTGI